MLKKMNVLFLCTGNSARSILGEAILRQHGGDWFNAYSAGSQPLGKVNPLTLELLQNLKFKTKDLRSKSWEEFSKKDSPEIDFVFTVCGSAAEETCPVWQGTPLSAHWGIDDPAARERTTSVRMQAFQQAFSQMYQRIELFLNLPIHSLERLALKKELYDIGEIQWKSCISDSISLFSL